MTEPKTKAGQKMLYDMGLDDPILGKGRHDHAVKRIRAVEDEAAALERKTSIAAQEAINEIHMGIEAELMKQIAALREAARLPRNVLIYDGESVGDGVVFKGDWVAVPRADWNALRAALTATEKHDV